MIYILKHKVNFCIVFQLHDCVDFDWRPYIHNDKKFALYKPIFTLALKTLLITITH